MTPSAVSTGPRNDLTDVAGVAVGHHHRIGDGWLTGTTVVLPPTGTVGGVDVRGGGPATRETDALSPTTLVEHVDAVVLTGGSAYGLEAAAGAMSWLEERGRGFRVGPEPAHVVPIVPAAALFDLGRGGEFGNRPTPEFGRLASEAAAADARFAQGSVGAGTGAVAGGLKGGIGSASAVLTSGATVGALVVVNSAGSPVDVSDGTLFAGRLEVGGEFGGLRAPAPGEVSAWVDAAERLRAARSPFNTVLAVVATDVRLTPAECSRLAGIAHDGLARAVNPVHTYVDGDVAFALATGGWEVDEPRIPALNSLLAAAADTVSRAVAHAVLSTAGAVGLPSYREAFPSALP